LRWVIDIRVTEAVGSTEALTLPVASYRATVG